MFSSFLALAAAPLLLNVQAQVSCSDKQYDITQVKVNVNHLPVEISRERTLYDLHNDLKRKLQKRTTKDNQEYYLDEEISSNDEWVVGGTSHGDIDTNTEVEFLAIGQDEKGKNSCVLFKTVDVNIDYKTTMTIAKDFQEGGCAYNSVYDHEKTRDEAYFEAVEMVAEKLRKDLPPYVESLEMGYAKTARLHYIYRELRTKIDEAVQMYTDHMLKMMDEYNEVVDNPEALKKMASQCKNEMIEKLKAEGANQENSTPPGSLGSYLRDFRKEEE